MGHRRSLSPRWYSRRACSARPALRHISRSPRTHQAATAIRIGDELWLGSYRGDRLAYLPMPE